MVGSNPRQSLIADAQTVKSSIAKIDSFRPFYNKIEPTINTDIDEILIQADALADEILSTKKCPDDLSTFNFGETLKTIENKILPCDGIC
ncbi:hypothetical protein Bealeia1_01882 [Candidatus Bealeia paramacronuclearis]|uniref:Uncharacterized protein n=1 Tax=Candidatus Bealeia paramacronuclearis TaxID=1921001 RepID=A0ABZ2C8E1_9PROT|nr:hypothetical protein [Candidatus Bealeia paramacronuclearis]